MPPIPGKAMLDRVIDRLWAMGQDQDTTQEQKELRSITLRFIRLRDLNAACYAAMGMGFDVWRTRTAERKDFYAAEMRVVSSNRIKAALDARLRSVVAPAHVDGPDTEPARPQDSPPQDAHLSVGDRQSAEHIDALPARTRSSSERVEHPAPS